MGRLAIHNYHDVFNQFPMGFAATLPVTNLGGCGSSQERSLWIWGSAILPYIEQAPLYNTLNVGNTALWQQLTINPQALQTPLSVFRCPSDIGPSLNNFDDSVATFPSSNAYNAHVTPDGTSRIPIAMSNDIAVSGTSDSTTPAVCPAVYGPPTGMLFMNSRTGVQNVTDGTSNTLMVGERCWAYRKRIIGAGNALGFSAATNRTSSNIRSAAMCVLGIGSDGINGVRVNQHDRRGFSSSHVGGAHFVMADGAVRFLSENIDYARNTVGATPGSPHPGAPPGSCTSGLGGAATNLFVTTTYARLLTKDDGQVVGEF